MRTWILATIVSAMSGIAAAKPLVNAEFVAAHSHVDDTPLVLAIIQIESGYNSQISSSAGAIGLMQVTLGAASDAAQYCSLPKVTTSQLYNPAINILYGTCYLKKQLAELDSLTEALVVYNGGYKQLAKLRKGEPIASETAQYLVKVLYLYNKGAICSQH